MNKYEKLYKETNEKYRQISNRKMNIENDKYELKLDIMFLKIEKANLETNIEEQENLINKIKIANRVINEQELLLSRRKKANMYMLIAFEIICLVLNYIAKEPFLVDALFIAGLSLTSNVIDYAIYRNKTKAEKNIINNYSIEEENNKLIELKNKLKKNNSKLKNKEEKLDNRTTLINKLQYMLYNLEITKEQIMHALSCTKQNLLQSSNLTTKNIDKKYEKDETIKLILKQKSKKSGGKHE